MVSETLVRHADDAYEAVRALNHSLTQAIPAPLAYDLLGSLQALGFGLPQLLRQLSAGLSASLGEYDVYDRNRDPAESVAMAREAMRRAADQAWQVGELLAAAQLAINLQGYTGEDHR